MSDEMKPSFFKAISNRDFTKLLRLPPEFFRRHELTLPKVVTLRVHSGRTWSVKVEKLHDGLFCFTEGWQFFTRQVSLQLGEFLVFTQLTRSKFDVVIYEKSFCERQITNNARNDVGSSRADDPLYFEICFKQHHKGRISLPRKFSIASGIIERKKVTVEYLPSHDRKSVVVDHREQSSANYRVDLAIGWSEFAGRNGLTLGNTYSFEFNPNLNLIHVDNLSN